MAYNNAIPNPPDKPSISQPQIKINFAGIKTLIDVNHETFDIPNQGMHKWITFPVQIASPLLAGDNGLYNVNDFGGTNKDEIFVHSQKSAGTTDIPMTASVISHSVPAQGDAGWAYLPSGIIMRWGSNAVAGGAATITLPATAGFPVFTTIYQVMLTPVGAGISVPLVAIVNNTQFSVNASGAGSVRFLVIGS